MIYSIVMYNVLNGFNFFYKKIIKNKFQATFLFSTHPQAQKKQRKLSYYTLNNRHIQLNLSNYMLFTYFLPVFNFTLFFQV